jgi:hypothetical protein
VNAGVRLINGISLEVIMSIPELKWGATRATAAQKAVAAASTLASGFIFGVQTLLFEDMVVAGSDMLERAQTESTCSRNSRRKWQALIPSRISGRCTRNAASIKSNSSVATPTGCSGYGEHVIEAASKLFKIHPLN